MLYFLLIINLIKIKFLIIAFFSLASAFEGWLFDYSCFISRYNIKLLQKLYSKTYSLFETMKLKP